MTVVTNIANNRALVTGSLLLLGGLSIYYFSTKAKDSEKKKPKESKDRSVPNNPDENRSQIVIEPRINPVSQEETLDDTYMPFLTNETIKIDEKNETVTTNEELPVDIVYNEVKKKNVTMPEELTVDVTVKEPVKEEITVVETKEETVTITTDDNIIASVDCKENVTNKDIKKEANESVEKEIAEPIESKSVESTEIRYDTPIEQEKDTLDKNSSFKSNFPEDNVSSFSVVDVPTATINEPADTPYAASSADENDIGTPENEAVNMPTFRSFDDIPEFIPQQKARKRSPKKALTRIQLIEQQRQTHTPTVSARCNHWPRCTNKHCKYWHPFKMCRAGDSCYYGKKCMFVHPSDYLEQQEKKESSEDTQQYF